MAAARMAWSASTLLGRPGPRRCSPPAGWVGPPATAAMFVITPSCSPGGPVAALLTRDHRFERFVAVCASAGQVHDRLPAGVGQRAQGLAGAEQPAQHVVVPGR